MKLTDEQIERYSRNIILPEIGGKGQKKLLESKVLVVGTGGLGSPVIFYLAAAGVGNIGIVDSDKVEISNLQRQIIHTTDDLGKEKPISAKEKIEKLNPDVKINTYNLRLTSQNIMEIIKDYDIVVDCSDNFPTRYLVNDACVLSNKPLSHGAIIRFDGQLTTIIPKLSACYRCVFEEPPPAGAVPTCQEAGVLGATCGIIGSLQANEVLKYLLGVGNLLTNKLFIFSGLEMEVRILNIKRNKNCAICGDNPKIKNLIDYEEFCERR
jgi:adenylyltransferase/sulfurtransferase